MAPILAEIAEYESCIGDRRRVVTRRLQRLVGQASALAPGGLRLIGPAVHVEPQLADRRPGERPP
jgi:hypothetical protein